MTETSYPPDKNVLQNNDNVENDKKSNLIGQAEPPTFCSCDKNGQIYMDFEKEPETAQGVKEEKTSDQTSEKIEPPVTQETPDPLVMVQSVSSIPQDMQDTARYFLYRTGRNPKTVNEKEIHAMREAFEHHYPARMQKEIDTACNRFLRKGKNLKQLYFGYIAAALRNQQSFVKFAKQGLAKQGKDGNMLPHEAAPCLSSDDLKGVTNTLAHLSMEEILAMDAKLDEEMK